MLKRSMVEVGYELLEKKQSPQKFNKFWNEVSEVLGLSEDESNEYISNFYTNLTLDERFVLLEDNTWDLRERQSFDKVHIDMNDVYSEIDEEEKELKEDEEEDEEIYKEYSDEDEKEVKLTRPRIERLIAGIRENEEYQAKAPIKRKEKEVESKKYDAEKVLDNVKIKELGIVYDEETVSENKQDLSFYEYAQTEYLNEEPKNHAPKLNIASKLISNVNSLSDLFMTETEKIPKEVARECIDRLESVIAKIKEKSH